MKEIFKTENKTVETIRFFFIRHNSFDPMLRKGEHMHNLQGVSIIKKYCETLINEFLMCVF